MLINFMAHVIAFRRYRVQIMLLIDRFLGENFFLIRKRAIAICGSISSGSSASRSLYLDLPGVAILSNHFHFSRKPHFLASPRWWAPSPAIGFISLGVWAAPYVWRWA